MVNAPAKLFIASVFGFSAAWGLLIWQDAEITWYHPGGSETFNYHQKAHEDKMFSGLGYVGCERYEALISHMMLAPIDDMPHRVKPNVEIQFGAKNACSDNYDRRF